MLQYISHAKYEAILQDKVHLSFQNLRQIQKGSKFRLIKKKNNNPKQLATKQSSLLSGKHLELKHHLRLNIYRTQLLKTRTINYTRSDNIPSQLPNQKTYSLVP